MRILISNDDGVMAEGIRALALALSKKHDVWVAAPATQQSAMSQGLTIHTHIHATEVSVPGAHRAWAVEGKPADCTKIGIYLMEKDGYNADIVFSGINHGGNYGWDTLYSGTIGAALEGNLCGRPSVAMSVNAHEPQYGFEAACEYACRVADMFAAAIDSGAKAPSYNPRSAMGALQTNFGALEKYRYRTISINVPDIPASELRGIRRASIGPRDYTGWVHEDEDERGRYYEYSGSPIAAVAGEPYEFGVIPEDNDTYLMSQGYATLSVILHDLTDYERQGEALKDLGLA